MGVARFCEQHLPLEIVRGPSQDPVSALRAAFERVDHILADPAYFAEVRALSSSFIAPWVEPAQNTGCTACFCCVRSDVIVCANTGDSRAVLCRRGSALSLSTDHKPNLPGERDRI